MDEIVADIQAFGTSQKDIVAIVEKYKADMAFDQPLTACGACGVREYVQPFGLNVGGF